VDVALRLAKGRGFESVGLREVAEEAGVALGTLYKSFRSKEEIVSAAVGHQTFSLRKRFEEHPAEGATAAARVEDLFARMTRALCRRPAYARAVLTAITSGHADLVAAVVQHEGQMTRIIVGALRGVAAKGVNPSTYTDDENTMALLLRQVWFAAMVGWAGKHHSQDVVVTQVALAARWLLAGAEHDRLERERLERQRLTG